MFHRRGTTGRGSDDQGDNAPAIDQSRLRAALRLMVDGASADRIVAKAGSESAERTIKSVARDTGWEWRISRLRLRRASRPHRAEEQPLGPGSGAAARGALALALHLGLGLSLESIAHATSTSSDQLGSELYQARLALEPGITPACGKFVSAIGRYRDGSLDIAARASLIQHAQHCHACRTALNRFQILDARLLDRIEQEQAALPPLTELPARNKAAYRQLLVRAAVLILATVILGAGVYAVAARRDHGTEQLANSPGLNGWLLSADVAGNITALNLLTGQNRPFDATNQPARPGYVPSSTALSPNGRLIANQVASTGQPQSQELIIETTSGHEINRISLSESSMSFAGWLGNNTVLELWYPPQESGESADDYFTRAQTHAVLTAVDTMTGGQHGLFTGAVIEAFPSPDGTMIAIVSTSIQSNSGIWTVELRHISAGKAGEPIASVTSQTGSGYFSRFAGHYAGQLVWAPDSGRVFAAITDAPAPVSTATPNSLASPTPEPATPSRIVAIERDGKTTTILPAREETSQVPLTISPDGKRLIVESFRTSSLTAAYQISELTLATGASVSLTGWSPQGYFSTLWSPDGSTLLGLQQRRFFLSPSGESGANPSPIETIALLVLDGSEPRSVMTRMEGDIGTNFVAWLPQNAFGTESSGAAPIRLSQPEPVNLSRANLRIETSAQVSENSDYIILHDTTVEKPVIWDRATHDGRDLPTTTEDLIWLPNTSAVIGTSTAQFGKPDAPSRLAMFASTFQTSMPSYDYQTYDPAQIGASLVKQYATPLMSPNENALAFFITDLHDQSVSLWLVDYDAPAKPVAHWALPGNNKLSYVPIAGWINNQTLLFAEPGDWHDGLPGEVKLNRLTVQTDGSTTINSAATLRRHGTERGIAIDELAVNQTSDHIAYRLRHFTKNATNDGIIDTIAIASADKLSDALEISRGGSSSGLSWSPDGRLLAATTPDDLEFYSPSGEAVLGVPNLDFPNEPRWIDQNTVWFNESNDQGSRIMRVDLQ